MKGILNVFKQYAHRLSLFLISGILINIAFSGIGSLAYFTKETSVNLQVKAADTKDILEKLEIKTDSQTNAVSIVIKKAANLVFSPTIYFSVDGELSSYILHINPVTLQEDKEYEVKISINGDVEQIDGNLNDILKGKITAKYLNDFISEPLDIQMSKEYLLNNRIELNVATQNIDLPNTEIQSSNSHQLYGNFLQDNIGSIDGSLTNVTQDMKNNIELANPTIETENSSVQDANMIEAEIVKKGLNDTLTTNDFETNGQTQ